MAMSEVSKLVNSRGRIKAKLTAFNTYLEKAATDSAKLAELPSRLERAVRLWDEFDGIQDQIEELDATDAQIRERENFENSYHAIITSTRALQSRQDRVNQSSPMGSISERSGGDRQIHIVNQPTIVKLPDIELPKFDGSYNKWISFRELFESLIDADPSLPATAYRQYLSAYSVIKLEQPVEHWNTILIHILVPKLDKITKREWKLKGTKMNRFPKLNEFIEFLNARSEFLESLSHTGGNVNSVSSANKTNKSVACACVSDEDSRCLICQGQHKVGDCNIFCKWPPSKGFTEVKGKRLCIKCLKEYHGRNCKVSGCKTCKGYHNTLLHVENWNPSKAAVEENVSGSAGSTKTVADKQTIAAITQTSTTTVTHCATKGPEQVILSTAIIYIKDKFDAWHECRALLDSGSQSNFMTCKLSDQLQLSKHRASITIAGINETLLKVGQQVTATIRSCHNAFQVTLLFLTINRITEKLPLNCISTEEVKIPDGVTLADPAFHTPAEVDILLGASIFWDLLCIGQVRLSRHQPIFQKTQLGWIISGSTKVSEVAMVKTGYCGFSSEQMLSDQVQKFWQMEEIQSSHQLSPEETRCEEHYMSTVSRADDGKFVVQLPLKLDPSNLGASFDTAKKRLQAVERKLVRVSHLKEQYHEFMRAYLQLGHMSKVEEAEALTERAHYLPHHAVVKAESTTTKVRVVFDAFCPTTSGKSLNDLMMVGPTIQDELFCILLRLRQHKYAMSADITKMYRQIWLHESQRHLQWIMWRWAPDEPICIFQLNTVTYGTASAPYLAIRCLVETARQYQSENPAVSKVISQDFYVDDLLTGKDDADELVQLQIDIARILKLTEFKLRKWRSNLPELCTQTTEEQTMIDEQAKILGLLWNTSTDRFLYKAHIDEGSKKITKRSVLSNISQLYDPLGLVGPVIVQAKIILQGLWQLKLGWDESIPLQAHSKWMEWRRNIAYIDEVSVSRRILCDEPKSVELHGFCDASEKAYGACVYMCSLDAQQKRTVRLVCAKSRIAPLKKTSLPRLELCGALLLAKLCEKIRKAMTVSVDDTHYWSDSTITLAWIAGESYQWHTFVANRVAEVH
ncbi:PREDICTED: uncharacterized protein LOC108764525 [Trachymyrmex cornetzi]|uniref:uncharacterized protein LOC108764525 n=1 Tax=Trachymyrmex cornetzi TaxID=471704 RepID=UPI00084F7396|nr:PREDICTED: uncharacterized protein LOC108764525 [Trachymyrmex cornetzi]